MQNLTLSDLPARTAPFSTPRFPSELSGRPKGHSPLLHCHGGFWDRLSFVLCWFPLDPLSFLHMVTCNIFLLRRLTTPPLAHLKAGKRQNQFSGWLGASQAFEPVELHKLNALHKLKGVFFFLLFGRKLSFFKKKTEQWHNCLLCAPVQN